MHNWALFHSRFLITGVVALVMLTDQVQAQVGCRLGQTVSHQVSQEITAPNVSKFYNGRYSKNNRTNHKPTARKQNILYTIPVVFHVFGTEFEGKTVTDAIIRNSLKQVNDDFNGLNDDFANVDPAFSDARGITEIEFALAQMDPFGQPTSGVIFYPNSSNIKGFGEETSHNAEIKQYAWDNYKYCNVYIMLKLFDNDATNESGIAYYPDESWTANNLARIVYNGRYLTGNTNKEFSSTLTHEFGHFLNLMHTFEGLCSYPNDYVQDTPPEDKPEMECRGAKNCFGQLVNGENYMGYTGSNSCYKMFTVGQVNRMREALYHPARITLWQPDNIIATGLASNRLAFSGFDFLESIWNDGSISEPISIRALGHVKFVQGEEFREGIHYTISDMPEGLSAQFTVVNETLIQVALTGKAVHHIEAVTLHNIEIELKQQAFAQGFTESLLTRYDDFRILYIDPYTAIYCAPDVLPNNSIRITRFELANIKQISGQDRYIDRGDLIADLIIGEKYTVNLSTATGNSAGDSHKVKIWLDLDGNFVFTDNETIWDTTFVIPEANKNVDIKTELQFVENVGFHKKTLRILAHRVTSSHTWQPCDKYSRGEVEDYTVRLVNVLGLPAPPPLSLYPNPSTGWYRLSHPIKQISLTNLSGQEVINLYPSGLLQEIDLSNLPAGTYLLRGVLENKPISMQLIKR